MQESYLRLFIHFHLVPELFLVLMLHVASTLVHDVARLLPRLLNFLESTVLLLLQQLNTISQ